MKTSPLQKSFIAAVVFGLGSVSFTQAVVPFSDNFNTNHDYFTLGTAGTGWDGIINQANLGSGSGASGGSLTWIASGNNGWEDSNNRGPLLYLAATGDFSMTVEQFGLTGGSFQTGGMVIWENSGDWVHYAANFLGNNFVRNTTDNVTAGTSANASLRFQRIDRVGTNFNFYMKANSGDSWGSILHTISRPDMPATLNVGLSMGNYGGGSSTIQYDNFSIVPEPASAMLVMAGAGMLAMRRKRNA